MIQNSDWIPKEYRAGGFNIYPTFLILKFFSILTSSNISAAQILMTGRILNIIIVNIFSISITYALSRIFAGEIAALVVTSIFAFSQFFYMQFWYPDSYIYFSVALVVLMLSRIQFKDTFKIDYRLLGIGYGIAVSTKWTTLALLAPIIMVLWRKLQVNHFSKNIIALINSFVLFAFGTILILNIGIFIRFSDFAKGFMFNLQNYGDYPGVRWSGYFFYVANISLNIFGFLSLPIMVIGAVSLIKKWKVYFYLLIYPLSIVILFGDKQWVVLRNIASTGPFLVPFLAIGTAILIDSKKNKSLQRRILKLAFLIFSFSTFFLFYFQTFITYTETDTRVQATNWIKNANLSQGSVGNNEFCSGESPATVAGLRTVYDPNLEQNFDYYVLNSYWDSPLAVQYRGKGVVTPFDMNRIHFEQWNSTKLVNGFKRVKVSLSDLPKGYGLAKSFHGNGPDIFILKKFP